MPLTSAVATPTVEATSTPVPSSVPLAPITGDQNSAPDPIATPEEAADLSHPVVPPGVAAPTTPAALDAATAYEYCKAQTAAELPGGAAATTWVDRADSTVEPIANGFLVYIPLSNASIGADLGQFASMCRVSGTTAAATFEYAGAELGDIAALRAYDPSIL